jgi:hypothetical protein
MDGADIVVSSWYLKRLFTAPICVASKDYHPCSLTNPVAAPYYSTMLLRQTVFVLILILLIGLGGASHSAQTPAKKITPADLQKLRWIEGTWRGTGINQPAFFERYRFESDSVLVVDSFEKDEKLTKVADTTRFELKNGEFGGGSEGSRYAASTIDDNSILFVPVTKARNSFIWKRETKDSWTAIICWPAMDAKPAGERVYNMERWPTKPQ